MGTASVEKVSSQMVNEIADRCDVPMQMPIAIRVYLQNCTAPFSFSSRCTIKGTILSPYLICLKRNGDNMTKKKDLYPNTNSTSRYFQLVHLKLFFIISNTVIQLMTVADRSKASVCDSSFYVTGWFESRREHSVLWVVR